MQIVGCGKGHVYDPEIYSSCPYCAQEGGGQKDIVFDDVGKTAPAYAAPYSDVTHVDAYGKTEPVSKSGGPQASAYDGITHVDAYGQTEPVGRAGGRQGGTLGKTEPAPSAWASGAPKVEEYAHTTPVQQAHVAGSDEDFQPVVGWLVCIDGPSKGRDYRIHSQNNYIGRARHMDICLEGDNAISSEYAAVIVYDDLEKIFYFGPDKGRNIVRLNKRAAVNVVEIKALDQMTIGNSTFVFMPLCGEGVDWNEL